VSDAEDPYAGLVVQVSLPNRWQPHLFHSLSLRLIDKMLLLFQKTAEDSVSLQAQEPLLEPQAGVDSHDMPVLID
jgi:hypothetical protein